MFTEPVSSPPLLALAALLSRLGPNWGFGTGPMTYARQWITIDYGKATRLIAEGNRIYADLMKFARLDDPAPNITKVSVSGGIARFSASAEWLGDRLNDSIMGTSIDVALTYDPLKRKMWATTLGLHPLVGVRSWEVVIRSGSIAVLTEAWERTLMVPESHALIYPEVNRIGTEAFGRKAQTGTWQRYLGNIGVEARSHGGGSTTPPTREFTLRVGSNRCRTPKIHFAKNYPPSFRA